VSNKIYHDFLAKFGIGSAHPGGMALTVDLLKRERLTAKTRVLDVGCGTGRTAAYLAKTFGCRVTALDQHPLMIEKARRRFQREGLPVELLQGDIHQLPFQKGTFDVVIAESVTIFTDLPRSLPEYARVLRPGGMLLDTEMTAERPLSAKELAELRAVYGTKQVPTETEWCGRLQRAGFDPVEVVTGGTVASAVANDDLQQQDAHEFDPSAGIEPRDYEVWAAHEDLTKRYSQRLGYRVFRARLKAET
jgi:ubiquinone/menaquinone biosynthesis C-methylase UbiE